MEEAPPAYTGSLDRHLLVVVHEGALTTERGGDHLRTKAGAAVLISAGECCRLKFEEDCNTRWLHIELITFDERSLGRILRNHDGWESAAVSISGKAPTALPLQRFTLRPPDSLSVSERFGEAMFRLFEQYRPGLPEFARDHFYARRWEVCAYIEGFVTMDRGFETAAENYSGGIRQLRRDVLLYLGIEPQTAINRRRSELASAWLRCGHTIDNVAKALGYPSRWEFECAYAGMTKHRCADIANRPSLIDAEPEELIEALCPFWWKSRSTALGPIPPRRQFDSSVMSEGEEAHFVAASDQFAQTHEANTIARAEFGAELRENAAEFFAMRSTGAEIIFPDFNVVRERLKWAA